MKYTAFTTFLIAALTSSYADASEILKKAREKRYDPTSGWQKEVLTCATTAKDATSQTECANKAAFNAMDYCSSVLQNYEKKASLFREYNNATTLLASLLTAAGASTLGSAKILGLLGGTAGISAFQSASGTEAVREANAVSSINAIIKDFSTYYVGVTPKPAWNEVVIRAMNDASRCDGVSYSDQGK